MKAHAFNSSILKAGTGGSKLKTNLLYAASSRPAGLYSKSLSQFKKKGEGGVPAWWHTSLIPEQTDRSWGSRPA